MPNDRDKEYVTKTMLNEALGTAVDTILNGVNTLFESLKAEIGIVNSKVDNLRDEFKGVKVELSHVKDEINGLKADLSTSPSRREFEELKARVDKRYPLS